MSSTSKTAITSLHRAAELCQNMHPKEGKAEIDKTLAEDPAFFMAYVCAVPYADKTDKPALIDKALALDATNLNEA